MTWTPTFDPLIERIRPFVTIKRADLSYIRWIETPEGDEGNDWCETCARFKIKNLRRHDRQRREDYFLGGGYNTEREHFCFCVGCGARLDHSLTDYGVDEEIWHYLEYGFSAQPGVDAYELSELMEALNWTDGSEDDKRKALRADLKGVVTKFLQENEVKK